MKDQKNHEKQLTFENITFFKDKTRFWQENIDGHTFFFDQRVSELYMIDASLSGLINTFDREVFEKKVRELEPDERLNHLDFIEAVRNVPETPVPLPELHCQGITNLKINTGTACNLDCMYCFKGKAQPSSLTDEDIFEAMNRIVIDLGKDADSYSFSFHLTSEPLLAWEQLKKIYDYSRKLQQRSGKYIDIFFMTNGTVINKDILKLLKKTRKGSWICISLDGPPEVHDKIRKDKRGAGTYHTIVNNLESFKKAGTRLMANAVITSFYPNPWDIVVHLSGLGFEMIQIKPVRQGTDCSFDLESVVQLMEGYSVYFRNLLEELLEGNIFLLRSLAADYALRPLWKILFNQRVNIHCSWGLDSLSMDNQGDLFPCDAVMGMDEFKSGNIKTGIDQLRFSIDHRCEQRGECRHCWARHICGGTCLANSVLAGNELLAIDPVQCRLNKHLVELNLKLLCELMVRGINTAFLKKAYLTDRTWLIAR